MTRSATPAPPVRSILREHEGIRSYGALLADGRPAFIKRIADNESATGRHRFAAELRFARALAHPSLPRLLDWGDAWMAFERLDKSLADPERGDAYRQPKAVQRLLAELGDALAYVHAMGVVHRDIKPSHIMFRDRRPVLVDFGIAVSLGDPSPPPEICGTPTWMAPEQLYGRHAGGASDVWSLAALGLFLLTGTRPYTGGSDSVIARRLAGEPPSFADTRLPPETNPGLAELLRQGLGPPEARPPASAFGRLGEISR